MILNDLTERVTGMDNAKVVENLQVLLAAVEAYPEELVNLSQYEKKTDCGTLFCSAGLAASLPHFNEMGLKMFKYEYTGYVLSAPGFGSEFFANHLAYSEETENVFGPGAYSRLFTARGCSTYDRIVSRDEFDDLTDKEVAIMRIQEQLEHLTGLKEVQ